MAENVTFCLEKQKDYRSVENMVRESFWNIYRPGCLEHFVLHELRDNPDFVKELDYVMEKDGKIIGQNMFMRAHIKADDGRKIPVQRCDNNLVDKTGAVAVLTHLLPVQRCAHLQSGLWYIRRWVFKTTIGLSADKAGSAAINKPKRKNIFRIL